MPATRRARSQAATRPAPYAIKGWLSRCHRSTRRRPAAGADDDPLAILPDDLLFGSIFCRVFSDAADVARCAAACRRWGHILAALGTTAICRSLPPPDRHLPHLALGFFHGCKDDGSARQRRRLAAASLQPSPWFVPMASATRLIGSPFPGLLLGGGGSGSGSLFEHARPVASRNGLVVLELCNAGARRAQDLALAVCNPMTGDVALVPPLAGPGHDYYACALLTADDLLDEHEPPRPRRPGLFFSLVLVYNRHGFTALRCYTNTTSSSSDGGDGSWGSEARKPGAKIESHTLRDLGQAVVLAGVAYWPMTVGALGVLLDGAGAAVVDVFMVPYRYPNALLGRRLLGTTPNGRLSYVSVGVREDIHMFRFRVETLDLRSIDDVSTAASRWEKPKLIALDQVKEVSSTATQIKMRWFCENSGTLFFTIGEGASTSGAFALNLATASFEKLAVGAQCNSWTSFCGYEMDHTALVASITARFT